jgi:NADH-ubiquinone oxidoreductase chain 1
LPLHFGSHHFQYGIIFFLSCTRLGVYTVLVSGWSSNSKYSILGGLRRVAQTISYEVRLALILISFLVIIINFNLKELNYFQESLTFLLTSFPLALIWFASSLAETNRTPFDLAEGESELVSGFNTEYRRAGFALIFLAEYASILFISSLIVILFLGPNRNFLGLAIKSSLTAFSFI